LYSLPLRGAKVALDDELVEEGYEKDIEKEIMRGITRRYE
jgi:hypothetical protein